MTRAKQTKKKFDPIKVVLSLKFMSLGYTMVTLRSETLLYMSTPQSLTCKVRFGLEKIDSDGADSQTLSLTCKVVFGLEKIDSDGAEMFGVEDFQNEAREIAFSLVNVGGGESRHQLTANHPQLLTPGRTL